MSRTAVVDGTELRLPASLEWALQWSERAPGRFAYTPETMAALPLVLRPGGVHFDIGCNVGITAVVAARLIGGDGQVVGFEANADLLPFCRALAAENGVPWVRWVGRAVMDRDDDAGVPFQVQRVCTRTGSTLDPAYHGPWAVERRVPTVRLDTYCEAVGVWPDSLKVDVEGAECLVLRGAGKVLERRPSLLLETHEDGWTGDGTPYRGNIRRVGGSLEEVFAILDAHGYDYQEAAGGGTRTVEPVTAAEYMDRHRADCGVLVAT